MRRPAIVLSPPVTRRTRRGDSVPAGLKVIGEDFASLQSIVIGGAPVHLVDERVTRLVVARATHERDEPPLAVCSINLDHIHHFTHATDGFGADGNVRWLNLIDGAPIATQARRVTGVSYPRLAGSDIIDGMLTDLSTSGLAVAVVGGSAEVTGALRDRLARDYPGVRFAGHWTPARSELSSREECVTLCDELRSAQADVILVCLGKPRQERWIAEYGPQTGASALLAFGAVVDFLAGRVSRAPRWVSRAGVEWMWRLMLEPRRLARRYLVDGPPAYLAVRRSRLSPGSGSGPHERRARPVPHT